MGGGGWTVFQNLTQLFHQGQPELGATAQPAVLRWHADLVTALQIPPPDLLAWMRPTVSEQDSPVPDTGVPDWFWVRCDRRQLSSIKHKFTTAAA